MVGQTISHYRILEKLGQGGMGVVYRAEDTRLGRTVAVKALLPEHARDPLRRKRLEQEARSAAALSAPGIAQVYELEEAGEDLFIIYEFVAGHTLRSALAAGPLPRHVLLRIAIETACGLTAAHTRGIVHRDLKPENVLQMLDGSIKILDFGLARFELPALDGSTRSLGLTEAGTIVGTVAYMSPEQLESKPVDFRSDIFSFGVMIYELATGHHPFKGTSPASTIANTLTAEPTAMLERDPLVPPELDRIVNKCLRKRPEWRYQSTRDLMVDLENLKYDSDEQRRSTGTLAAAEEESLLRQLARFFRLSPRRWWELNLLSSYAWYALFVFLAWRVRELSGSAWANVLFFSTVFALTVLTIMRTILVNFTLFNPQELPGQVKRLAPWIQIVTLGQAFVLLDMGLEMGQENDALAALLAALGMGALLVAAFYERMVDRGAFPQIFAKHDSAEAKLALAQRSQFLRLAGGQIAFLLLLILPLGTGRLSVKQILQGIGSDFSFPALARAGLAVLLLAGAVALGVSAGELWRGELGAVRSFRRRFVLYFLLDLFGIGIWLDQARREVPGFVAILLLAILVVLPFLQLRLARELLASRSEPAPEAEPISLRLRWWWVHHLVVIFALIPINAYLVWKARQGMEGHWGAFLFLEQVVAMAMLFALRFVLANVALWNPNALPQQASAMRPWIRGANFAIVAGLWAIAVTVFATLPEFAAVVAAWGAMGLVSTVWIESAVHHTAFPDDAPAGQAAGPR